MTYVTIDGFEDLTPQQVFDISKNHLLQQNEKSLHTDPTFPVCAYHGKNGKMCAAGPFLKDSEVIHCEGVAWAGLNVPDIHCDLVDDLQKVHDLTEPSVWPEKLAAVAAKYHLVY